MDKIKYLGLYILAAYMFIGIGLALYMDYELIRDKGIWAYLFRGDDHGMWHIALWPFYL